jgi:hypothetical protein
MKRQLFTLISAVLTLVLMGACGGRTGSAPKMPDGSKIAIMVVPDRGITPDMEPARVQQIEQLASWMETDLVEILNKTGYAATRTEDPNVQPGPGRYVLRVTITKYNAGSKAARMLVGFGAGAATLDTHFELVGEAGNVEVTGDPSVGSGRDWKNAARKVNLQTVDTVNARIKQSRG